MRGPLKNLQVEDESKAQERFFWGQEVGRFFDLSSLIVSIETNEVIGIDYK
jgi:hypothetical protein